MISYPSLCIHSRFGPRTIAMFPGVILFTSWYSVSLERNLIKYLFIHKTGNRSVYIRLHLFSRQFCLMKLTMCTFNLLGWGQCNSHSYKSNQKSCISIGSVLADTQSSESISEKKKKAKTSFAAVNQSTGASTSL